MSGLEGLLTGQTLVKRYRIEEVIGRGGFAAVYRADDERLGRPVAVKVITVPAPDAESAARHRERFEREARAAASLPQHPNVVTVHDFGVDPVLGLDFLVMEFLHGEDLATRLRREGRPGLEDALRILREAAAGIAVGHRAGIVHRDVKPGNIFLARGEGADGLRVCILDFGIARVVADDHTLTGAPGEGLPLSPAYASPEQTRGARDLTPASDVFSLGVVAYQLLTGEKPFTQVARGLNPADWVPHRSIRELVPQAPEWIEAVVERAMAFAPEDRFSDAEDFGAAFAGSADPDATLLAPAASAVVPTAEASELDSTLYQPAPEPPRERQRLVFSEPPPARRRSRVGPILFLLLLGLGAAGAWWYLAGGAPATPIDPSAAADLEVVEEELDERSTDEPTDLAPSVREVTPVTPGSAMASPAPGATPPQADAFPFDTVPATVIDTVLTPADTSSPTPAPASPDTINRAPTGPVQRPPPRVIGIPVDSVAGAPVSSATSGQEAAPGPLAPRS